MPELHDLLEQATNGLEPDVTALVRGGHERGERMRSRRRRTMAVVGVAAALVLGGSAWLTPGVLDSGHPDVTTPAHQGHRLPSPGRVATVLGSLLPDGTAEPDPGQTDPELPSAMWTPGTAAAREGLHQVLASVSWTDLDSLGVHLPDSEASIGCDPKPAICRVLPDGSYLTVISVTTGHGAKRSVVSTTASLSRPDGLGVTVSAFNGRNVHTPALGMKQMAKVVQDPRWFG